MRAIYLAIVACVSSASSGYASVADALDRALRQFAWVEQVFFNATVQVQFHGNASELCCAGSIDVSTPAPIEGDLMFAINGDRWRLDSFLDPQRYPSMHTTLMYTGDKFAYFEAGSGVLATQINPSPEVWGIMLPNPAFEIVQFLFPLKEENAHRQVTLSDIKQLATQTTVDDVEWVPVVVGDIFMDRAVFPGAEYEDVPYEYHVFTNRESHDRPLIIDRVDTLGQVITRTRLSSYEMIPLSGGASVWPRVVVWQAFDPLDGLLAVEISMVVEQWIINEPGVISEDLFDADSLGATIVVHEGEVQP